MFFPSPYLSFFYDQRWASTRRPFLWISSPLSRCSEIWNCYFCFGPASEKGCGHRCSSDMNLHSSPALNVTAFPYAYAPSRLDLEDLHACSNANLFLVFHRRCYPFLQFSSSDEGLKRRGCFRRIASPIKASFSTGKRPSCFQPRLPGVILPLRKVAEIASTPPSSVPSSQPLPVLNKECDAKTLERCRALAELIGPHTVAFRLTRPHAHAHHLRGQGGEHMTVDQFDHGLQDTSSWRPRQKPSCPPMPRPLPPPLQVRGVEFVGSANESGSDFGGSRARFRVWSRANPAPALEPPPPHPGRQDEVSTLAQAPIVSGHARREKTPTLP